MPAETPVLRMFLVPLIISRSMRMTQLAVARELLLCEKYALSIANTTRKYSTNVKQKNSWAQNAISIKDNGRFLHENIVSILTSA